MHADQWNELKTAFAELADLPAPERAARLQRIARERPDFAARLESLLAADAAADSVLGVYEGGAAADALPAEAADPLGLAGTMVAHFRVEEVLGVGGMGVAYRAYDTRLNRSVALKFLLPGHALDVDAKALLLHEARAASALDHPNVCTVFEVGETAAGLFFAMPAYTGETLRQRLARDGALPRADAVELARQLLHGLAAAHAAGITHRDLKPGNLIVTADGTLKILDFGLAKMRDLQGHGFGTTPGTMAYMSPEQLGGDDVDQRTDLWSAGVVLHEMLTGACPFGTGDDLVTPYAIMHEEPPPAGSSPELDAFVATLLAKSPADRFATAGDALAALDAIARSTAAGTERRRRRRDIVYAVLAAGVLIAGTTFLSRSFATDDASALPSVAVLPFTDATPAGGQAHLAEGIAEEILVALAQVPELRVPGRRSSFAFAGRDVPTDEIARQLGVASLVTGSVLRTGDRVHIRAQLLDARTGRPMWSDSFVRPVRGIVAVRSEIAATLAERLTVRLTAPAAAPPRNFAAYELYLRGRFHWHRRTPQDLDLAIDLFRQATLHDSTYAQPWAGLALAWAVRPPLDGSSNDMLRLAEEAAARALALDSTLADAHAARGYALHWQWRWQEAEREFQRAIELDPAHSTAHQWYGEHLAKMGRGEEGERLLRRAIDLDPLSLVAQNDLGIALFLGRRYDESIAQLQSVTRADPAFVPSLLLQHRVHLIMGEAEAAADAGRRAAELSGLYDPAEIVLLARATADPALRPAAVEVLARWAQQPAPRWPDIAMYYTLIGEHERAIAALERALEVRSPHLAQIGVTPWLDPLRGDPRVKEMLRAVGLQDVPTPPGPPR